MQPRIGTLLSDPIFDRPQAEQPQQQHLSHLPPPRPLHRRPPLPVEPSPVGDEARKEKSSRRNEFIENDFYPAPRRAAPSHRQKSSVPIAEVLNNEDSAIPQGNTTPTSSNTVTPFSGRLSDILLDTAPQPRKRRKLEGIDNENNPLTLPKPAPLKKPSRRPRIPPLLQGLHHPPDPPTGRLYPPITGEGGAFPGDLKDRLRSPVVLDRESSKEDKLQTPEKGKPNVVWTPRDSSEGQNKNAQEKDREESHKDQEDVVGEKSIESQPKPKEKVKRNKWGEEETKDLLLGVSRFGIGNWKRILQCPDYTFHGRTAVDLKDRFRTCCGDPQKKPKSKSATPQNTEHRAPPLPRAKSGELETTTDDQRSATTAKAAKSSRKPRSNTDRIGAAELAEMGIEKPFEKSKRRDRRQFTDDDDNNLLEGFYRHGPVWHLIRSDFDLGFQSRHPTDLRDRFRIRFPEKYAEAGYKLKPKDAEKQKGRLVNLPTASQSSSQGSEGQQADTPPTTRSIGPTTSLATPSSPTQPSIPQPRPHALLQPLHTSFSSDTFSDFGELVDDTEAPYRPVLSRTIFQWADANNPPQSSTTLPTLPHYGTDMVGGLAAGMDGVHINPQATLKLPSANLTPVSPAYGMATNSTPMPTIHTLTTTNTAAPSSGSTNPFQTTSSNTPLSILTASSIPTSMPISNTLTHPTSSSFHNSKPSSTSSSLNPRLLNTPNLPTIIIPNVPAASARSAVHNLPPPADLLSGVETEGRGEVNAQGWDDGAGMQMGGSRFGNVGGLALGHSGTGNEELGFGERSLLNSSI